MEAIEKKNADGLIIGMFCSECGDHLHYDGYNPTTQKETYICKEHGIMNWEGK